jgi:hypothetical protein
MSGASGARKRLGVKIGLLACVVLGAVLRARGLTWQIPMDDEWHGIDFALSHDVWFLFTHFSRAGANSVPWNLYLRGALDTIGWTEVTIVLPSLIAGVGLLWLFPRWIARRFGSVPALVSAAVLAISPFLVFYSRMARAYSVVLFFECFALLALLDWLREARRRHAVVLVVFGALAVWTHAAALASMAGALTAAIVWRALLARREASSSVPSVRQLIIAGIAMLALAGSLWLPALMHPLPSPVHPPARFASSTFTGLLQLWIGSANPFFELASVLTVAGGVVLLARSARGELIVLAATVCAGLVAVLLTRPNLAGTGFVLARYLLPAYLLGSLAVGVAAQAIARAAASSMGRTLRLGAVFASIVFAYVLGPLPRIHGAINSFTKHPAFQASYGEHDPDRALPDPLDDGVSVAVRRSQLQPFYSQLARERGQAPIIEYPFLLGEDVNLLYFPQQLHRRPVLAGYYTSGAQDRDVFGIEVGSSSAQVRVSAGYIVNATMVDHVLGTWARDRRIRFRTVVNILDPVEVARSGAEYLVLHGNLLREFFQIGPARIRSNFVTRIRPELVARYGVPVFENDLITVFRLRERPR